MEVMGMGDWDGQKRRRRKGEITRVICDGWGEKGLTLYWSDWVDLKGSWKILKILSAYTRY